MDQRLLLLEPQYRERVWGGRRLRPADPPIGEAWIAFGGSRIRNGPLAGATLAELIAADPASILGARAAARYRSRFPLLIKLLDCADWLSLQVHPNDEQARRMVGPDEWGKTEAWYFIETDPHARILLGVRPRTTSSGLAAAIREGRVIDMAQEIEVHAGEAVLIPAGTVHALGPGLLLYEIQQASDTTYRIHDWDRPQAAGRKLHIEESAAVAQPAGPLARQVALVGSETGTARAIDSDKFRLDLARIGETPMREHARSSSFQVMTAIDGAVELTCGDETAHLERFETALLPAGTGRFEVRALDGQARLLRAMAAER